MTELVKQPSKAPTRKMLAGAAAGIITAALQQWAIAVSDAVPALAFLGTPGVEELLPILAYFAAGYIVKEWKA